MTRWRPEQELQVLCSPSAHREGTKQRPLAYKHCSVDLTSTSVWSQASTPNQTLGPHCKSVARSMIYCLSCLIPLPMPPFCEQVKTTKTLNYPSSRRTGFSKGSKTQKLRGTGRDNHVIPTLNGPPVLSTDAWDDAHTKLLVWLFMGSCASSCVAGRASSKFGS